jgi:glycosyltransferase involved in cell wall biosynthesis
MSTQYGDEAVDIVSNSVDKAQFFAPDRGKQSTPTIGVLFATSSVKGLDVSLSALRMVREHFPGLRVISFGTERPSGQWAALLKDIDFFLCPPQDQIRDLYSLCDVWLTASRSEGFNLPAMEAMACRTPVVSTRTGWPAEAVKTGVNGILVDVDDQIGLARGVQWVLSRSDEEWRHLSSNAYATVASSSWEQSAKLFEEALKRGCKTPS